MKSTLNTEVYDSYEAPTMSDAHINWEEVETKVSILVRKFGNIDDRYRDDLAQELRIHAMIKSDDYYDLHRRAIDFWRSMQRKVYPEIPFMDLEIVGGSFKDKAVEVAEFNELVDKIKLELTREGTVAQVRLDTISARILDIILEDMRDSEVVKDDVTQRYIEGRINCTYLEKRLPDIHYKMILKAVKNLGEVAGGLSTMRNGFAPLSFEL